MNVSVRDLATRDDLLRELEILKKEYERIEEEAARRKRDTMKEERVKKKKVKKEKENEKMTAIVMSPVHVQYKSLRTPLRDVTKKMVSTSVRSRRQCLMEPLLPMKQLSFDDVASPSVSQISSASVSTENDNTLNDVCSPIEEVSRLTDVLETQLRVAEAAALKSQIPKTQRRRRKSRKPQHFHVKLVQADGAISLKRRVSLLQTVQKSRASCSNDTLATKTLRKISAAKNASLRELELESTSNCSSSDLSTSFENSQTIYSNIPSPPRMMAPVLGGDRASVVADRLSSSNRRRVSFQI